MIRSPLILSSVVARPEIARLLNVREPSDTIAMLAKQVKITPVGESYLFKILYTSSNAECAAAIVNAITESYFQLRDKSDAERTQAVVAVLEKEKAGRLEEVLRMRQELSEMARRVTGRPVFTAKAETDSQTNALADLQGRLVNAQVEAAVLAARLEAAQREIQEKGIGAGQSKSGDAPPDPSEASLREAMIEKAILERPEMAKAAELLAAKETRQKEIELRLKDGKNDPLYAQIGREIAEDRQAIEALKKSLRGAVEKQTEATLLARRRDRESVDADRRLDEVSRLQAELQGRRVMEQRLQAEYDKELKNVKKFSGNTLELEFKRDELARAEKVFELISARALQLRTERMAPTRVELLRMADVPRTPIEPYPIRLMAVAVLMGLSAPFALAFGWERWIRRVSDSHDLPATPGLAVVGEIARMPRRLPLPSPNGDGRRELEFRVYQESFDNLQTTLTLSENIGALRIIAVTSATSDEGKTSVASQLAMSLSRSTRERVLVIDGDMRSPDIHCVFQIPRDPGLAAVLAGQCELSDAIVTAWSDRVHLLPAGKPSRNPLDLLADEAWPKLLAKVPADYRYVVIDTPPLLAAAETLVFAKAADAALICTMRDRSRADQVLMVYNRLKSVGGRPVGVVLNGVPTKTYVYRYGAYQ